MNGETEPFDNDGRREPNNPGNRREEPESQDLRNDIPERLRRLAEEVTSSIEGIPYENTARYLFLKEFKSDNPDTRARVAKDCLYWLEYPTDMVKLFNDPSSSVRAALATTMFSTELVWGLMPQLAWDHSSEVRKAFASNIVAMISCPSAARRLLNDEKEQVRDAIDPFIRRWYGISSLS